MDVASMKMPVFEAQMRVQPSSRALLVWEVLILALVLEIILSYGGWGSIFEVAVALCVASTIHALRRQETAARRYGLGSYEATFRGPAALAPGAAMLLVVSPLILVGVLLGAVGILVASCGWLEGRLRSINFPRRGPTRGML